MFERHIVSEDFLPIPLTADRFFINNKGDIKDVEGNEKVFAFIGDLCKELKTTQMAVIWAMKKNRLLKGKWRVSFLF